MIDFERICKEHPKDADVVCLFVDSIRAFINNFFKEQITEAADFLDLPFPETDNANYHLGNAAGVLNLAVQAGFLNIAEFYSFCEQIKYTLDNNKVPNEIFELKPWC